MAIRAPGTQNSNPNSSVSQEGSYDFSYCCQCLNSKLPYIPICLGISRQSQCMLSKNFRKKLMKELQPQDHDATESSVIPPH